MPSLVIAKLPNTLRVKEPGSDAIPVLPAPSSAVTIGARAAILKPLPANPAKNNGSIVIDEVKSIEPLANLPMNWSLNAASLSSGLNKSNPAAKNFKLRSVKLWNQPEFSAAFLP